MRAIVYKNKEKGTYMENILKSGVVDTVKSPELGKYWIVNDFARRRNLRTYHQRNGEKLKAQGFEQIEVEIKYTEVKE